jgi:hypothetical protein
VEPVIRLVGDAAAGAEAVDDPAFDHQQVVIGPAGIGFARDDVGGAADVKTVIAGAAADRVRAQPAGDPVVAAEPSMTSLPDVPSMVSLPAVAAM